MEQLDCTIPICGIPVNNFPDSSKALEAIEELALRNALEVPVQVNFINAHVVNCALADPETLAILNESNLNIEDGVGVWLGGVILSGTDMVNLNGTDFGLELLRWGAAKGLKFYFLGAKEGIAEEAKEKLCTRIPGLRVVGTHNGYLDQTISQDVVHQVLDAGTDILFVCMGVPSQEKWVHDHRPMLKGVKATFGLGAFFDFYADAVKRAPLWMRKLRMEWIYRLYKEPRRLWKRYLLGNIIFLWHVFTCLASRGFGNEK